MHYAQTQTRTCVRGNATAEAADIAPDVSLVYRTEGLSGLKDGVLDQHTAVLFHLIMSQA